MKFSYKLSDAIHILSYIVVYKNSDLSSKAIAASVKSNPSLVRQLMANLSKAGLILTHKGTAKPMLAKKAEQISLLDIFQAINMDHNLFHVDPETEPKCIVGGNIQPVLDRYYHEVELAALNKMSKIKLADIIHDILEKQKQKKEHENQLPK